jgi:hypothetical protein
LRGRAHGFGLGEVRAQRLATRIGHRGLVAADRERGAAVVGVRLRGDFGRAVLVDVAARDRTAAHEVVVAAAIGFGERALRVRRADRGLRRAHVRRGEALLGVERRQRGVRGRDRRVRALHARASGGYARVELFGVDAHERNTLAHALVVLHEHLGDEAAHFGRDHRAVGLQVGVVGGFAAAWCVQPEYAGERDRDGDRRGEQRTARAARRRGGSVHLSITSRVEVAVA